MKSFIRPCARNIGQMEFRGRFAFVPTLFRATRFNDKFFPSQRFDIVVLSPFFLPFFLSLSNTNEIVNGFGGRRVKPESNVTGNFIVGVVGRRIRFRTVFHGRQTFRKTYFRSTFFLSHAFGNGAFSNQMFPF